MAGVGATPGQSRRARSSTGEGERRCYSGRNRGVGVRERENGNRREKCENNCIYFCVINV